MCLIINFYLFQLFQEFDILHLNCMRNTTITSFHLLRVKKYLLVLLQLLSLLPFLVIHQLLLPLHPIHQILL